MAEETPNPQPEESEDQEFLEETPITDEPEPVEPISDEVDETESEEDGNLVQSERGQKRIQELANKARKAEELEKELDSLKDRLTPKKPEVSTDDILEELRGEEIPYTGDYLKDLQLAEQRATEKAIKAFEQRQSVREKFKDDIAELESKYSELKVGSSNFDPDLTNDVVELYRKASNLNPKLELKTFVDGIMKIKNQSEKRGKSLSVQDIVEQEQSSALRPSAGGVKRVNKDPKEMTLEELEEIVPR